MTSTDPPRFRIIDAPSPFHRLERFAAAIGGRVDIWAKREDLLPLAFGGNKLRNLEFLVGAALADGADTLVTSGRRWSNHCRLTAAAGTWAGLAVELVLSGPPAPGGEGPGIRLMRAYGATVQQLATAEREERAAAVDAVVERLKAAGRRPYVIPVGGSGMPGVLGQVEAARELGAQLGGTRPTTVYLPTATGGTQAGLLAGVPTGIRVIGVVVARSADELRPPIRTMLDELGSRDVPDEAITFDESQLGDGYGRPTGAATEAAGLLARTEAILVDPIYTAKALAALVAAVRLGRHDGESIVFWHAGGTPGVLERLDQGSGESHGSALTTSDDVTSTGHDRDEPGAT
ncbi:MAG: pyridoxal-phosphate dependent enzyme [Chloroflexota bacterium]